MWASKGGVDRQVIAHVKIGEILWNQSCPLPDGGINGACIEMKRERAGGAARVAEKQAKAQKGKKKGKHKGASLPAHLRSGDEVEDHRPRSQADAAQGGDDPLRRGAQAVQGRRARTRRSRARTRRSATARTTSMNYYAAEARFRQGDVEYEKFLKLAIPDKLDFSPAPPGSSPRRRRRRRRRRSRRTRRSSRPGSPARASSSTWPARSIRTSCR